MGIYVKEENQPWNHKQIAGNATGDDALDATSENNIKNKVVAGKLGNTDISDIGDGTVTGGISQLSSDLASKQNKTWILAEIDGSDGGAIIPAGINEVAIKAVDTVLNTSYIATIAECQLPAGFTYFYLGSQYTLSNNNASLRCQISKSKIKVNQYYINERSSSNNLDFSVYYR